MDARNVKIVLRQYMRDHNCTQQEIAYRSGLSKSFISMFLNGYNSTTGAPIYDIKTDTIEGLARAMNMTFEELVAKASGQKESKTVPVISCLNPDDNLQSLSDSAEDFIVVSKDLICDKAAIGLKMQDDKPQIGLLKNDIVIVLLDKEFRSGDLLLLQFGDFAAEVAKVYKQADGAWIILCDSKAPKYYSASQQDDIIIIGKIIAVQRLFV